MFQCLRDINLYYKQYWFKHGLCYAIYLHDFHIAFFQIDFLLVYFLQLVLMERFVSKKKGLLKKKRKECLIIVSKIAFVCTNWCWSEEKLLQTCTHTVNLFYHLLKKLQLQLHIFFKREWDKSLMLQIWKLICMCQVCSVYCLTLIKKSFFFILRFFLSLSSHHT